MQNRTRDLVMRWTNEFALFVSRCNEPVLLYEQKRYDRLILM